MGREEARSPLFGLQSDPVPRSRSNQELDSRGVVVMHSPTTDLALSVVLDVVERWGSLARQLIGTNLVTSPDGLPTLEPDEPGVGSRPEDHAQGRREASATSPPGTALPRPCSAIQPSLGIDDGVSGWEHRPRASRIRNDTWGYPWRTWRATRDACSPT